MLESATHGLWNAGSVVVACGLSCPMVCEILPEQGLNLHRLHSATTDVCRSGAHALQQEKHSLCYWVQAFTACPTTGQWIWETRDGGKEEPLFGEPAD